MDKRKLVVGFLAGMLYLDTCLGVTAMIHLPPPKLPSYFYPIQPSYFHHAPNPYEHDCFRYKECWWGENT